MSDRYELATRVCDMTWPSSREDDIFCPTFTYLWHTVSRSHWTVCGYMCQMKHSLWNLLQGSPTHQDSVDLTLKNSNQSVQLKIMSRLRMKFPSKNINLNHSYREDIVTTSSYSVCGVSGCLNNRDWGERIPIIGTWCHFIIRFIISYNSILFFYIYFFLSLYQEYLTHNHIFALIL